MIQNLRSVNIEPNGELGRSYFAQYGVVDMNGIIYHTDDECFAAIVRTRFLDGSTSYLDDMMFLKKEFRIT